MNQDIPTVVNWREKYGVVKLVTNQGVNGDPTTVRSVEAVLVIAKNEHLNLSFVEVANCCRNYMLQPQSVWQGPFPSCLFLKQTFVHKTLLKMITLCPVVIPCCDFCQTLWLYKDLVLFRHLAPSLLR